jgi:hypothetical protein
MGQNSFLTSIFGVTEYVGTLGNVVMGCQTERGGASHAWLCVCFTPLVAIPGLESSLLQSSLGSFGLSLLRGHRGYPARSGADVRLASAAITR